MAYEIQIWNKVMSAALGMPGVKVDRDSYLRAALGTFYSSKQVETAVKVSPLKVLSKAQIDNLAKSAINSHTTKVTAISAAAGIPGGWALAATVPADLAQYYFHVFVLSQKLAYLYGYPDLLDENGNVTDDTVNFLTLFTGVMMGAAAANNAITEVSKKLATTAVKRLPKQALTKGVIYPIVKKVAAMLGYKMTKDTFAKGVGKIIPIAGGVVSGLLTFATYKPGAKKLQKQLQENMSLFYSNIQDNAPIVDNEIEDAEFEEVNTDINNLEQQNKEIVNFEKIKINILINIAYIDNNITDAEKEYITNLIDKATLDDDEKFDLVLNLKDGKATKINYQAFKNDEKQGISLLSSAIELLNLDHRFTLGERLYIKKIGKELGFSPNDIDELMK